MPVVAALALPDTNIFELAVACEVFGLQRPELGVEWYEFEVCAVEPGLVPLAGGGLPIQAGCGLGFIADVADTVVVPASPRGDHVAGDAALEALRVAHARGARLMSYCTGAFVLADTGLLDGRRATTHWMYTEQFRARFPAVELVPDVLYVDEGDLLTSAGTAAAIDLSLHVVRQDFGIEVANAVARRMVVPPHRDGGQAQYAEAPVPVSCESESIGELLDWMAVNLAGDLSVRRLATRLHMSPRTFARRFREATGTTPHQWLTRRRVEHARLLLETTDLPIERVASDSGFGSPANLRKQFRATIDVSPSDYRRLFGGHGMRVDRHASAAGVPASVHSDATSKLRSS